MSLARKAELLGAFTLLIALITFASLAVKEREARIRAELTSERLDSQKAAAEKSAHDLEKQIESRDAVSQKQIEALARVVEQVKTVQQGIAAISKVANSPLPAKPYVAQDRSTIQAPAVRPGDVVIPQESAPQMWQQYADDHICRQQLAVATQDLADAKKIALAKQQEVDNETRKAQTWEQAAKGGTKIHRFIGALKQVGIGVAVGVVLKTLAH